MTTKDLIHVNQLCESYQVEVSFFNELHEFGLIEIIQEEQNLFVPQEKIEDVEKMIRMHQELHINLEGIDAVFNLLSQMEELKSELNQVRNRLRLYELE